MARPESGLWEFLRTRMPAGTHATRIESQDTAPGFPDVHLTFKGVTWGWELKCQEFPTGDYPFRDEKKGLRKSQRLWIRDELEAGGKVMLVLQLRQLVYFLPGLYYASLDNMTSENLRDNADLTWERSGNCNVQALAALLHRST